VVRQADRREVVFAFDENPEASERVGTIVVGGKRFTVLQQAAEAAPSSGGDLP